MPVRLINQTLVGLISACASRFLGDGGWAWRDGGRIGQADFDSKGTRAQRLIRACSAHAFELLELARTI